MKPRRLLLQENARVIPNATTAQADSSSMAVTALVLVSALFFLAFFSVFARRFFSPHNQPSSHPRRATLPLTHPNRLPRAACLGVDAATLKAMPVLRFSGGETWCVVCLGGLEEKEKVKVIPGCGHVFHPACIDAWLGMHGSCPLCRCSEIVGFGDGDGGGGEVEEKRIGRSRSGEWTRIERMVFLRRTCSF
ncbi:hypothetical protein J5N97_024061 [Dioscorea zingiberensis]|uniref:RING-type E3 ubiquitin transferase n=1 Tax=Dioscorea zingiberensis TaxID=325984 RepID=A0A9D5H8E7_9LILI|nr:hypothetical protein J5N97_024061 [Dioscorea zingiberensis]